MDSCSKTKTEDEAALSVIRDGWIRAYPPRWMKAKDFAVVFGVSIRTANRLMHDGKIPTLTIGGIRVVDRDYIAKIPRI